MKISNNTLTKWIVVILLVLTGIAFYTQPARADDSPFIVGEFTSQPGESKDAFVTRVAKPLLAWTVANEMEACGAIAEKDGLYSIILTTQNSQLRCDAIAVYRGWTFIQETLHSHVQKLRITITARTAALSKGRNMEGDLFRIQDGYSPADYKAGAGYLVNNGQLLYQHGKGTQRVVANLK